MSRAFASPLSQCMLQSSSCYSIVRRHTMPSSNMHQYRHIHCASRWLQAEMTLDSTTGASLRKKRFKLDIPLCRGARDIKYTPSTFYLRLGAFLRTPTIHDVTTHSRRKLLLHPNTDLEKIPTQHTRGFELWPWTERFHANVVIPVLKNIQVTSIAPSDFKRSILQAFSCETQTMLEEEPKPSKPYLTHVMVLPKKTVIPEDLTMNEWIENPESTLPYKFYSISASGAIADSKLSARISKFFLKNAIFMTPMQYADSLSLLEDDNHIKELDEFKRALKEYEPIYRTVLTNIGVIGKGLKELFRALFSFPLIMREV